MRTEKQNKNKGAQEAGRYMEIDPETLWCDISFPAEEMVQLDPLCITPEMELQAEQPELADFFLQSIPERKFSLRMEEFFRKQTRLALRKARKQGVAGA